MLTIFCGDHTVASRDALLQAARGYQSTERKVIQIDAADVPELLKSGGSDAFDLFSGSPVYETVGLVAVFKRKYARKAKEELRSIAESPSIDLLDWESKSAYDMGLDKEKGGWVKDSKTTESTFTLLPALSPGRASPFLQILDTLSLSQPIEVTFSMIARHVRLMIALASGTVPRDNPFLVNLARSCLRTWDTHKLTQFHYQLQRIESNVKTGSGTPLSMRDQLEIVVAMML
ncbi:MAG: hypothetical protein WCO78_03505 [Candidatus Roizmanbacteria bacterium]